MGHSAEIYYAEEAHRARPNSEFEDPRVSLEGFLIDIGSYWPVIALADGVCVA